MNKLLENLRIYDEMNNQLLEMEKNFPYLHLPFISLILIFSVVISIILSSVSEMLA